MVCVMWCGVCDVVWCGVVCVGAHVKIYRCDVSNCCFCCSKTRGMNFNFPPKKGSGIEVLLPHASRQCVQIIISMCEYDPEQRTSAKHILRHPYFKEFRYTRLTSYQHYLFINSSTIKQMQFVKNSCCVCVTE